MLSFNNLLGACGTAGYEQEAESILQDMLRVQLRPDGFSYLNMIKANGHKSAKEAERWFSTALSARVNVDTGMFNAVSWAMSRQPLTYASLCLRDLRS